MSQVDRKDGKTTGITLRNATPDAILKMAPSDYWLFADLKTASRKEFWLQWRSDIVNWNVFWGQRQVVLHLSSVFLGLSAAKLKEDIFVEPQIREVLKDTDFRELLNLKELRAWEAFKSVWSGFLGNTRVTDYQACIEKLLKSYKNMECWMSLKIHFLHSHLNFFPPNLGAVSDEHGERFHQDITKMEGNYQGKWNPDILEAKYTRSSKKTHFWLSVLLWIV